MTDAQAKDFRQQVSTFEKSYTSAVNTLAQNPGQTVSVEGAGIRTFNVSAAAVISRLSRALVVAAPGVKSPAADSTSSKTIQINDPVLGRGGQRSGAALSAYQQMAVVHEGIHRTGWGPTPSMRRSPEGEWSTHGAELGYPSNFEDDHREGYNRAAMELLGE
ncbi:MAG: hypothetical protein WDO68_16555 [Gammaproteobacteria bacterium]